MILSCSHLALNVFGIKNFEKIFILHITIYEIFASLKIQWITYTHICQHLSTNCKTAEMPTISIYFQGGLVWESGRFPSNVYNSMGVASPKSREAFKFVQQFTQNSYNFQGDFLGISETGIQLLLKSPLLEMYKDFSLEARLVHYVILSILTKVNAQFLLTVIHRTSPTSCLALFHHQTNSILHPPKYIPFLSVVCSTWIIITPGQTSLVCYTLLNKFPLLERVKCECKHYILSLRVNLITVLEL